MYNFTNSTRFLSPSPTVYFNIISLTMYVRPFDLFILANIFATCGVLALMNPDPAGDSSGINLKLVSFS